MNVPNIKNSKLPTKNLMCCCKKKGQKKVCSDSTTTVPLKTAHSSTSKTLDTTGNKKRGLLNNINRTGSAGKTSSKPKVGDVHRKILTIEENPKVSEKQMEEAMQALGCSTVNTTIIQRLEKASKELCQAESQVSIRQGDIQFTLAKTTPRRKKDDDTLYPLHKPESNSNDAKNVEEKEIELLQEDWDNEPNSENYMWNTREIRYTCVLIEATGDPCAEEDVEKIEWDPFAPIDVLQQRGVFDCHTLRKNTFLSTALCCSNKAEQKAAKNKPKTSLPKKVKVIEPSRKLTRLRPEYSLRTNCTVGSEQSLDRTPVTQETVEVTPRSKTYRK